MSPRAVEGEAPLEIVVHTGGLEITGEDPVDLSLGGSETAVVSMARALAARGHRVTVSANVRELTTVAGVSYVPMSRIRELRAGRESDLLIVARDHGLLSRPPRASMVGLWHHDMPPPVGTSGLRRAMARADFSFFLSRFHRGVYEPRLPGLGEHAVLTTNGVDFEAAEAVRAEAEPAHSPRFVYASRVERGLAVLLSEIWPAILERLPRAELLVTAYDSGDLRLPAAAERHERYCRKLAGRTPGVRTIGPLTRREFWRELAASTALLYPTNFPEINCMVALEAQALGVPIVTTDGFALSETVGCRETRIGEPWRSFAYAEKAVDLAVRLIQDGDFRCQAITAGHQHVSPETHSWAALAESWERLFHERFAERFERSKAGVLRSLLRRSDVAAARLLAEGTPDEVFDPHDLAELSRRAEAHARELETEPRWCDFAPGALPPQLAKTHAAVLRFLAADGRAGRGEILDVGCGEGNAVLLLLAAHPGLELVGVDGNAEKIAFAEAKARELGVSERVSFHHRADPHFDPEFLAAPVDVVLLSEVLEYFEDPAAVVEWAEARARLAVVGYAPEGPWERMSGDGGRLHHLGERGLRELLGGKRGLELEYLRMGETPRGEELGCWFFRYRPDSENRSGRLDLETKIRRTRPLPKISVTVMVKNEEAHIRRSIESLEPIADEIWVGDTGATDATPQILASMGFRAPGEALGEGVPKKVVPLVFKDFAQARNDLAVFATSDWILWQDADEILVGGEKLRELVDANTFYDAFGIEQRHVVLDAKIDPDHPLRCFRPRTSDGPLGWVGCIHETVEHRINEPPKRSYVCPEIYLAHLGYLVDRQRTEKAFERNWPLFLEDRRQNPGRWSGYVLGVREYLLLAKWEIERAGQMTTKAYRCLNHGWELWRREVRVLPARYRRMGFRISRQILEILARHDLPLRATGKVPLHAELALEIAPAGRPTSEEPRPRKWTFFADPAELREAFDRRLEALVPGDRQAGGGGPPQILVDRVPALDRWELPPELFDLEPFDD